MSEWKQYKLGDLCLRITKGTTPTKGQGFVANGINFIKSESIGTNGRIDKSRFAFIDEKTHYKLKRSWLQEKDILFSMAGVYLAKSAIVTSDMLPANTNQALAIIRINQEIALPKYINYYLMQNSIVAYVNNMSGQSAQPNVNFQEIASISVLLPSIPEQKAIAKLLSSLDDKIDLLHRQNKTLEAMAETLFRQWFVEVEKDGWEEKRLGEVLSLIESGSRPKGGIDPDLKTGIPSVGAENINGIGQYDYSKTKFVTEEFFKSMRRGTIQDYDVLIYKDGAYVGRKGMFGHNYPYDICTINEHVFILRSSDRLNQIFLYFLVQEDDLAQLNANSAQPGLNQEAMRSFEIIIPPKPLIDEFANMVKPGIDKIFFNAKQIRTLEKLRDTLLPKLMSGEVRVAV